MWRAGASGAPPRRRLVRPVAVAREVRTGLVLLVAGAIARDARAMEPVEQRAAEAGAPQRRRAFQRRLVAAAHDDQYDAGREDRRRDPDPDDLHHHAFTVPRGRRVVTTSPVRIAATPSSCSPLGRSAKMSAPRITAPIGWKVSSTDVIAAGSRRSDALISSPPTTCDVSATVSSQPCAGQEGTTSRSPTARPIASAPRAATDVASKSGPAGRRRSLPPARRTRMKPA